MSIEKKHKPECMDKKNCDCKWLLDYRPQGLSGPRRRLEFDTKKEAERHRAETQVKVSRGEYVAPEKIPTFKEAAARWFQSRAACRPSHVSNLRSLLDTHLLLTFGPLRLDQITVAKIEGKVAEMQAERYAARTINRVISRTSAIFDSAIRRGEATANPVKKLERVHTSSRELEPGESGGDTDTAVNPDAILAPAEIRVMLSEADAGYYRTLFALAFVTGMRQGELLALRWSDVELAAGKVYVRRNLSWARGAKDAPIKPRFFEPKTKAGIRAIPIAPEVVLMLKAWKLQCPKAEFDLVFPHVDGQPNTCDRVLSCGLYPALRRAKLRKVRFHSLRHSCASAMIAAGRPITEIQHRLGHASPAITLKVYSHFFKDAETPTADCLAGAIFGGSGQNVDTETALDRKSA